MATNDFLGTNVVFQTRDATLGGTWKTWVCETTLSGTLSSTVNTTETKCGPVKSVGVPGATINLSGVANVSPTGSQTSLKDALDYANNQTLLEGRMVNLAIGSVGLGDAVLLKGDGYVTSVTANADEGQPLTFDAVFEITGSVDTGESNES